jgi:hypothetical protein
VALVLKDKAARELAEAIKRRVEISRSPPSLTASKGASRRRTRMGAEQTIRRHCRS